MPHPTDQLGVVRVALHHPHRVWVDTLQSLLNPRWDVDVVAANTNRSWVSHAVKTGQAEILLLYLDHPDHVLAETLAELRAANSNLKVVGLSESVDRHLLVSAVRAGVRGWVEPTASVDHLVATLHGVAVGETWIPPALLTPLLATLLTAQEARQELGTALSTLSAREVDVLCCLVHGMSRQDIADRYVLSTHTVRTHINNLLRKLDVHSTLAAVSLARQAGLAERHAEVPEQRESP